MSLKHAILGFLAIRPLTGYDLKKAFDNSVSHFWPATQSQIYRTLTELDTAGLVTKEVIAREERLDMKIYHIAEAGRIELQRWLSAPVPEPDTREPMLIQLFFGSLVPDEALAGVIEDRIREVEERLELFGALYTASLESRTADTDGRAFFMSMLTLEYALMLHANGLRWVKSALARIRVGDYTPAPLAALLGEER